jgi:hypothetical protein
MTVRKAIWFTPTNWEILRGYMQRKGLESPSLAVEDLILNLLKGAADGRDTDKKAH